MEFAHAFNATLASAISKKNSGVSVLIEKICLPLD